jgi:muconolactone D-isomerase
MEFMVTIKVNWPPSNDEIYKLGLIAAEADRARVLVDEGMILRLWRIPGRWENVGIWEAENATKLHEAISSLPMSPWLDVTVVPLAHHPSDPGSTRK